MPGVREEVIQIRLGDPRDEEVQQLMGEKRTATPCPVCSRPFKTNDALQRHLHTKHPAVVDLAGEYAEHL